MPSPATITEFFGLLRKSGLIDERTLSALALELPREPAACASALVSAELLTPFQAKQLLAGRPRGLILGAYRVLRPLGKGGMGVVYLAEHAALKRKVAVKVLSEEQSREKLSLERFFREARAAAALDHPNIVRLHDIAESRGTHYLVMEFVDGTDLQALIERTGPLHTAQAAGYIAQAAAGLQHAHDRGFIHRDIKPANLIVAKDGTVKVLDMGLARSVVNASDALTGLIDKDVISGTADFLSPEQALNVQLDTRTDVYSLGATFYTLLTGRPPYEGGTAQKLAQHQMAAPPDVRAVRPEVPAPMAAVIARMMAKQPVERYQTASAARAALAPWVSGLDLGSAVTVSLQTESTSTELRRSEGSAPPRETRGRWLKYAAIVLTTGLLTAGALYAAFGRAPKSVVLEPAPEATSPSAPEMKLIHAFDLSGVTAFRLTFRDGVSADAVGPYPPAPGLYLHCWKKESVAEFRGDATDGRPWVGVTNLNPDLSSQILFQFDEGLDLPLVAGRSYRVRVEYRTSNEAHGHVAVRNPKNGNYSSIAEVRLEKTDGAWKSIEATFRRPVGGKIDVCVLNDAVGEGNLLAVRSVEVFEIDLGK